MLLSRRINQFQAFQALPGHTVDNSQAQATLNTLLTAVIKARQDVDQVSLDNSVVIVDGTLPDGTQIQFDQNSLDLMDRVHAVFLTQTFGDLILSGSSSVPAAQLARLVARHSHAKRSLARRFLIPPRLLSTGLRPLSSGEHRLRSAAVSELTYSQAQQLLVTMQTVKASSDLSASSAKLANAQNLADQAFAVLSGVAAYVDSLPKSATPPILGPAAAVIGDIRLAGEGWGDLAAYVYALATGNQALANTVVEEANAVPREEIYTALADMVLAIPAIANIRVLAPVSTTLNLLETTLDIDKSLQEVDSTQLAIENSFSVPPIDTQGIAYVTGMVNVPTNQGIGAPLSGIQLSSDQSDVFTTIADPSGNYDIFVPLQDPNFDYANANVAAVDPISQTNLGSETVDLSSLTTATPLQIPTLQGNGCNNIDFDDDDPDCD
jgi:hypothetical protein